LYLFKPKLNYKNMSYLDNFKQAAIWAFNGTSFDPEKRGEKRLMFGVCLKLKNIF
jgi:hypothetical protein